MLVCDPRRNALLKEGNKSDKIDARKLADLLRTGMLRPVYHGEHGLRTLRELGRSYQTISQDLNRVMNRIKALYRGWSIPCAGTQVYAPRGIGKSGYRRSSMPACIGVPSYSINSWMDCRDCDEPCALSCWRRAGNNLDFTAFKGLMRRLPDRTLVYATEYEERLRQYESQLKEKSDSTDKDNW